MKPLARSWLFSLYKYSVTANQGLMTNRGHRFEMPREGATNIGGSRLTLLHWNIVI
jgi:hypothetical protein